jgi:hypothetical protein
LHILAIVNFGVKDAAACMLRVPSILLLASAVAACTQPVSPQSAIERSRLPADFPETYYRQAEAAGNKILRIDPTSSLVTIDVRRGGALARLGHDHVVASRDVRGYVDLTGGRADLYVQLDRLTVDEPDLRTDAGLATQLAAEAIDGTRRNMLEKVLESERFPFALIHVTRLAAEQSRLYVEITLHDTLKSYEIPLQIKSLPAGMEISGRMSLNQTDFGIVPYSILGGALHVQDRVDLRFRILAGAI